MIIVGWFLVDYMFSVFTFPSNETHTLSSLSPLSRAPASQCFKVSPSSRPLNTNKTINYSSGALIDSSLQDLLISPLSCAAASCAGASHFLPPVSLHKCSLTDGSDWITNHRFYIQELLLLMGMNSAKVLWCNNTEVQHGLKFHMLSSYFCFSAILSVKVTWAGLLMVWV